MVKNYNSPLSLENSEQSHDDVVDLACTEESLI